MNRFIYRYLLLLCSLLTAGSLNAETITVGGVGGMAPLMQKLADRFVQQHPAHNVTILHPPLGSGGGIRALAGGRIDIAMSGRPLKEGEKGQSIPWLKTPLVLASQEGVLTNGLDSKLIADIYAGRKTQWDNGLPMRLVIRGPEETEIKMLRAHTKDIEEAISVALKRTDLPVGVNDLDALALLRQIKGSIGTTTLGLLRTQGEKLKVFPLNGHQPSLDNLLKGHYPLARDYFLITPAELKPAAAAFVAFLQSAAAQKLARQYDYIALPSESIAAK